MTDIDKEREAINDKALDEHVERAKDISDWSENGPAVWVIADLLGDITDLRARVKELEAEVKTQMEVARRMDGLLYEARQVTREQLDRVIGMIEMKTTSYEAPACAEGILEVLNLEIVEEAPKAEGRWCGCEAENDWDNERYDALKETDQ